MADVTEVVSGMPKKDTTPSPPAIEEAPTPTATVAKIKEITKELAQPWIYGTALHRFAKRHKVHLKVVQEISKALTEKQAEEASVETVAEVL